MVNISKSTWIFILIAAITLFAADTFIFILPDLTSPPLCHRDSCINKDPANERCDRDVKTLVKKDVGDVKIELRYSRRCDAGWSRAEAPPRSELFILDSVGNKYGGCNKYGRYTITSDTKSGDHFGDMGAGKNLRACVQLPDNGRQICTEIPS